MDWLTLGILAVIVVGFTIIAPRATFGLIGAAFRGLFNLLSDAVALLLAWI